MVLSVREGRPRLPSQITTVVAVTGSQDVAAQIRDRAGLVAEMWALGIPASEVANPCRLLQTNFQLLGRRYFEAPEHPVVGPMPLPSFPFRFASVERWLRTPAPTLGQDNGDVLCRIRGLSSGELRNLEAGGVIGTRPARL